MAEWSDGAKAAVIVSVVLLVGLVSWQCSPKVNDESPPRDTKQAEKQALPDRADTARTANDRWCEVAARSCRGSLVTKGGYSDGLGDFTVDVTNQLAAGADPSRTCWDLVNRSLADLYAAYPQCRHIQVEVTCQLRNGATAAVVRANHKRGEAQPYGYWENPLLITGARTWGTVTTDAVPVL